ncbi:MAG TPA: ribonuclease HII [Candidatus Ligilactobacillus excrementigallinarum]|uniref:Ribonuclease HII n=1 Tax=Candidatus Ligilactobacillus excrementigallinarum TaxID=2838641 RepID=A0A9D1UXQ9_9LACO|nr:ribonuclease HII [Candidatus Ligilactobacillus excrementigallinarum]
MKINEIKAKLNNNPTSEFIESLKDDSRKGVQTLLKQYQKRVARQEKLENDYEKRMQYERRFWQSGKQNIAGIDEVGRGPLAGPVVAAAVILPHDFHEIEVNDSKQLTSKVRKQLYQIILDKAISIGIGIGSSKLIDKVNIYEATKITMKNAVRNLTVVPDQLIIDAMSINTEISQLKLIKGDAKSVSVSAASIVAKEFRDSLMCAYAEKYPGYDFEKNVGYGTKKHLAGLAQLGITPIHRQSFSPVTKYK